MMRVSTIILIALFIVGCASLTQYSTYKEVNIMRAPQPTAIPSSTNVERVYQIIDEDAAKMAKVEIDRKVIPGTKTQYVENDLENQLFGVSMIFTIPISANIDDSINAEFIIDPKRTEEEIKKVAEDLSGQIITDKIQVSRTVTARLIAPSFTVYPDKEIRQAISVVNPTKWNWVLKPTEEGEQTIQLKVVAHVLIEGERVERELETFKRDLTVVITPEQKFFNFVNEYLEFILGTLIIPFLLWLFSYIRSKIKKDGGEGES